MQKYMPKSAEEIAYIFNQAEILQRSYEFSASIKSFWRSRGAPIYIIHREDMLHRL